LLAISGEDASKVIFFFSSITEAVARFIKEAVAYEERNWKKAPCFPVPFLMYLLTMCYIL
jgi:hypothetical protein